MKYIILTNVVEVIDDDSCYMEVRIIFPSILQRILLVDTSCIFSNDENNRNADILCAPNYEKIEVRTLKKAVSIMKDFYDTNVHPMHRHIIFGEKLPARYVLDLYQLKEESDKRFFQRISQ